MSCVCPRFLAWIKYLISHALHVSRRHSATILKSNRLADRLRFILWTEDIFPVNRGDANFFRNYILTALYIEISKVTSTNLLFLKFSSNFSPFCFSFISPLLYSLWPAHSYLNFARTFSWVWPKLVEKLASL